jgi:hypothetical protein
VDVAKFVHPIVLIANDEGIPPLGRQLLLRCLVNTLIELCNFLGDHLFKIVCTPWFLQEQNCVDCLFQN